MLEPGWYLINDHELFLFAANGFWDREERMQTYRAVKERYCGKEKPLIGKMPEQPETPEDESSAPVPATQRCRFLKQSADGDFYGLTCYAHGIEDCRKHGSRLYVDTECFSCTRNPTPSFPDSATLIRMADTEWHNREERRGIHERVPWTAGWMSGYLTPDKPAPAERQEIVSSEDRIKALEWSLEWYKKRANMLQCWQSSMRDPERKIVCAILANGFTLTTKKEIDNAAMADRKLLEDLQTFIDDPDSREGCPLGTVSVALLVRWMSARGYTCE